MSGNPKRSTHDIFGVIDNSIEVILQYCSASNWDDIYPKVLEVIKQSQNLKSENPEHQRGIEIIATLYMDSSKLTVLLNDVLVVCTNMKRPVLSFTIEYFLQKALGYWLAARPQDYITETQQQDSSLSQIATSLFEYLYISTENTKRPLTSFSLLGTLLTLKPADFLDEEQFSTHNTKSKVMAFKRHTPRNHAYSFLSGINSLVATPAEKLNAKVIASSVAILRAGCIFHACGHANPIVTYSQKLYPLLLRQLFGTAVNDLISLRILSDYQALFVTGFSVLNPDALIKDVCPILDMVTHKERLFEVRNILLGVVTMRQLNIFSTYYRYVMDKLNWSIQAVHIEVARLLTLYEAEPNFKKALENTELHRTYVEIVSSCFTMYKYDPGYLIRQRNYNFLYQEDPLFLALINALLSSNELLRSQAIDFCWSFMNKDNLLSFDPIDMTTNANNSLIPTFLQLGALARALAEAILKSTHSNDVLIEYLKLIKGTMKSRILLILQYNFDEVFEHDPSKYESNEWRHSISSTLETTMYVCILSSDIAVCKLAFEVLSCLVQEAVMLENLANPRKSSWSIMPIFAMLSEFSNSSYVLTGTVAAQKRLYQFFQRLQVVTPPIVDAWQHVNRLWRSLSQEILHDSNLDRLKLKQWRSYSGMLCSLVSPWLVVDGEIPVEGNLSKSSKSLLNELIGFLSNIKSPFLRETARDVLSTDAPHPSYHFVFKAIELEIIERITSSPTHLNEQTFLLLEQGVGLLRSVAGIINEGDIYLSTDIGALALTIVQCLDSVHAEARIIRLQVQYCNLMELIAYQRDSFNIQHNNSFRSQIVVIFSGWLDKCFSAKFSNEVASIKSGSTSDKYREPENERLQKELMIAIIQTFTVILTDLRMEHFGLKDSEHEKAIFDDKSQKFGKLFMLFLRILQKCRSEEVGSYNESFVFGDRLEHVKANTIECASKLLNANLDVGLKFALPLGYKDDLFIRVSFIRILENILTHTSEEATEITEMQRYQKLADFMTENIYITVLLCDVCPAIEVDDFSKSLLQIFESKGKSLELVKQAVTREITKADTTMDILRRNCVATKILSIYAHQKGLQYLKVALGPFLQDIITQPELYCFDPNPDDVTKGKDLDPNSKRFNRSMSRLVTDLQRTIAEIPAVFREMCHAIASVAGPKFPTSKDASVTAVSSFFFLRFICPALVTPDNYGLVDEPPSKEVRRTLLVLAKMLQSMAFGSTNFAKHNFSKLDLVNYTPISKTVVTFLRSMSVLNYDLITDDSSSSISGPQQDDLSNMEVLHKFLYYHWEDINHKVIMDQRLRSIDHAGSLQPSNDVPGDKIAAASRELSLLIRNLGRPRQSTATGQPTDTDATGIALSDASATHSPGLREFLLRNKERDMSPIIERGLYYEGVDKEGMPLLVVNCSNFNKDEIDVELSLCRFFQVASKMWKQSFAFFFDYTGYTSANQFPSSAQTMLRMLVPEEMTKNCVACYYYNVPSDFLPALKTSLKQSYTGIFMNPRRIRYEFLSSEELPLKFNISSLNLNPMTARVLSDVRIIFNNVYKYTQHHGMKNVSVRVGNEYVQIKAQEPFMYVKSSPGFTNDIYALEDILDVYTSGTNGHPDEFTIELGKVDSRKIVFRCSRGYEIVRAILNAKSRLGNRTQTRSLAMSPETSIASLLNIAFSGLCSGNPETQEASYNLLASIQHRFSLNLGMELHGGKGLRLPANVFSRVQMFSAGIAKERPDITMDMLEGVFGALDATTDERRQGVLMYAIPWIKNIETHVLCDGNEDKYKAVAALIRKFLDISIGGSSDYLFLLQSVWSTFLEEPSLIPIVIDEVVFLLIDNGIYGGPLLENITSIVTSKPSPEVCGIVMQRVREIAIDSGHIKGSRLRRHPKWRELVILTTILSAIVFENPHVCENFFPELCLCMTLCLQTGSYSFRTTLYNLCVNMMHSFLYSPACNAEKRAHIRSIWADLSGGKGNLIFGTSEEMRNMDFDYLPSSLMFQMELGCSLLIDLVETFANPKEYEVYKSFFVKKCLGMGTPRFSIYQSRAILALGCFARVDIDDNIVTKVLEIFYDGLTAEDGESKDELMTCLMFSISKIAEGIRLGSRYLPRLFWMSVAIIGACNNKILVFALKLLQITLKNLVEYGALKQTTIAAYLMDAKEEFGPEWSTLEKATNIQFTEENFEIALTATLIRGFAHSTTRAATMSTFETLLSVTAGNAKPGRYKNNNNVPDDSSSTGIGRKRSTSSFGQSSIHGASTYFDSVPDTPTGAATPLFLNIPSNSSQSQNVSIPQTPTYVDPAAETSTLSSGSVHFTTNGQQISAYMPYLVMLYLGSRSNTELSNYLWMTDYPEEASDKIPAQIMSFIGSGKKSAILTMYLCSMVFQQVEVEEMVELRVLRCMQQLAKSNMEKFFLIYFTLRGKIQDILDHGPNMAVLEQALETSLYALLSVEALNRIPRYKSQVDLLLTNSGLEGLTSRFIEAKKIEALNAPGNPCAIYAQSEEIAFILKRIVEIEETIYAEQIEKDFIAEGIETDDMEVPEHQLFTHALSTLNLTANNTEFESGSRKSSISTATRMKKLGIPTSSLASLTMEGPPSKISEFDKFEPTAE